MLYKVTPMMPAPQAQQQKAAAKAREPGQPRKKRKTAIYDADGNEVLITLMCLKCRSMRPLAQFGLRKMADGAIRNQPWCRTCRGATGGKKKEQARAAEAAAPVLTVAAQPEPVLHAVTPAPVAEPVVDAAISAVEAAVFGSNL